DSSMTSMWQCACGLTHSILVTTPLRTTGLAASYSAANEWWATTGVATTTSPIPVITAANLGFIARPRPSPRLRHLLDVHVDEPRRQLSVVFHFEHLRLSVVRHVGSTSQLADARTVGPDTDVEQVELLQLCARVDRRFA